jgi:hypothetical protein
MLNYKTTHKLFFAHIRMLRAYKTKNKYLLKRLELAETIINNWKKIHYFLRDDLYNEWENMTKDTKNDR